MKRAAFTLVESLMALVISSLVIMTLGYLISAANKTNRRTLASPTDWYLFIVELESSDRDFALQKVVNPHQVILAGEATGKEYEFVFENQQLFLRLKQGGGYLPLLYQVQSAKFTSLSSQRLKIEVGMKNGKHQQAIVNFAPPAG